ncbi:MAG: DUF2541 family protein [Bacteroidetes bacterium]|jgi:hypothetical protein|nr:DUF2541 family protein [Bacteroidota bacterium]MCB0605286.1 DUF2541 family protein [Saprospiraceae bacterium]MCO5278904.1 DUF2541 family protein [Saprospiraceae bacterium]
MKINAFLTSIIVLIFAIGTMSFTNSGWRNLGTKTVNYRLDKDVMDVQLRDGVFNQLKLVVRGGTLNMHKITVYFENGGQQDIEVRQVFQRKSSSRIIDLKGNNRFIEKIVFWYDSVNLSKQKAQLSVLGR